MARGIFHKVGGVQARDAERHGFVKVDRATARRFFDNGKTVIVTGSRVDPAHFIAGYKLAIVLDRSRQECVSCPELLPGASGSSRAMTLARRSPAAVHEDFDAFMVGVDREMKRSPYGPHAVTFVLRKEFPRLG